MKKYNLAFRFRIHPNEVQVNLILQTFGCVRFVYNKILAKADETYKLEGKNKIITPASLKSEFPFLKEVDSLALATAQMNVQTAFANFFRTKKGFPKFKSKTSDRKSTRLNSSHRSLSSMPSSA